jgi:hypothetical protein
VTSNHLLSVICLSLSLLSAGWHVPACASEPFDRPPFFSTIWAAHPDLVTARTEAESISEPRERAWALLLLAEAYLGTHEDVKAKEALEQSLSSNTAGFDYGFTQRYVRAFVNLKQFDQALSLLQRAPNKFDLEESRLAISEGYLQSGQLDAAYEILKAAPPGVAQLELPEKKYSSEPVSSQLVELAGKALANGNLRQALMAINSIRDPYDRAIAYRALSHYYDKHKDEKLARQYLDRAFDEAKGAPAVILPYRPQQDRSTARLLTQFAGEYGSVQPMKAKAALQAAIDAAAHEYDTSKYTNGGVASVTIQTLQKIGEQAKQLKLESMVSPLIEKLLDRLAAQAGVWSALTLSEFINDDSFDRLMALALEENAREDEVLKQTQSRFAAASKYLQRGSREKGKIIFYETLKKFNTIPSDGGNQLLCGQNFRLISEIYTFLGEPALAREYADKISDAKAVVKTAVTTEPKEAGAPEFDPQISGAHPALLEDKRIEAQIDSLLEAKDFAGAFDAAQNISQRDARAKEFYTIARKCEAPGACDTAMKALDMAIQADPEMARQASFYTCITTFTRCHHLEDAYRFLRFAKGDSDYYEALRLMADAYCTNGELKDALNVIRAVPDGALKFKLSVPDNKVETLRAIADKAIATNKMDLAVSAIESLDTSDNKAVTYQTEGKKLIAAGRLDDARSMLDQALAQALATKARIIPMDESSFYYESTARLLGSIAMDYKRIDPAKAEKIWQQAKARAESGEEKVCKSVYGLSPLVEKLKIMQELDNQGKELGIEQIR